MTYYFGIFDYIPLGEPRTVIQQTISRKKRKKGRKPGVVYETLGEDTVVPYGTPELGERARLVYATQPDVSILYGLRRPGTEDAELVLGAGNDALYAVVRARDVANAVADEIEEVAAQAVRAGNRSRRSRGGGHVGSGQLFTSSCTSSYDFWCNLTAEVSCEHLWGLVSGKAIRFGIAKIGEAVTKLSGPIDGFIVTKVLNAAAEPTEVVEKKIVDLFGRLIDRVSAGQPAYWRNALKAAGTAGMAEFLSQGVGKAIDAAKLSNDVLDGPCAELNDSVGCNNVDNKFKIQSACCGLAGGSMCGSSLCCRDGFSCARGAGGSRVCTCTGTRCADGGCAPKGQCCPKESGCDGGQKCYVSSSGQNVCARPLPANTGYTAASYADDILRCVRDFCSSAKYCCVYRSSGKVSGCVIIQAAVDANCA